MFFSDGAVIELCRCHGHHDRQKAEKDCHHRGLLILKNEMVLVCENEYYCAEVTLSEIDI